MEKQNAFRVYNLKPLEELKFLPVGLSVYRIAGKRVIKIRWASGAKNSQSFALVTHMMSDLYTRSQLHTSYPF